MTKDEGILTCHFISNNVKNGFLRRIIICHSGIKFILITGVFQTNYNLMGWLESCCDNSLLMLLYQDSIWPFIISVLQRHYFLQYL
jgi:hypothetical protein